MQTQIMPFFKPLIIAPLTVLINQLLNNLKATSDHVFIQSMHHSTLDYNDESAVEEVKVTEVVCILRP